MSKAFTREDDAEPPERPGRVRSPAGLPAGAINFMTAQGAAILRAELDTLGAIESGESAGPGTRGEGAVAERIAELRRSLESATVVPVPTPPPESVVFGATVTLVDHHGNRTRHRIVGVDETDLEHGWISWVSPLAKMLIGTRIGQKVRVTPDVHAEALEVVAIEF